LTTKGPIVVADYDPAWPRTFARLRDRAWPLVAPFAQAKTDFVRACLAAAK
jgi:hypothetical protein